MVAHLSAARRIGRDHLASDDAAGKAVRVVALGCREQTGAADAARAYRHRVFLRLLVGRPDDPLGEHRQ
jgi:hypothetical protein